MKIGRIKKNKTAKDFLVDTNLINIDRKDLVDNYVKLSILSILAGYKKSDYIYVNDCFEKTNLKKLDSFISYVLNHNIAPKRYNIRIKHKKRFVRKNKLGKLNNYDSILCFSGGLDSTAGLLYALNKKQKILPIWIDFGQRNNIFEHKAAKKPLSKLNISFISIKIDLNRFILDGWREWDFIVPGRNFLFLSLANAFLQNSTKRKGNIYLCAHKDEMGYLKNRDKSKYFFEASSNLFSNDNKKIIATTPFDSYSKSEIISYWRRKWEKKFRISPHETTTCYYENGCGICEACLKRAIYLTAAGYNIKSRYKINPFKDPSGLIIKKWIPNIISNQISRSNKLDFLIAIEESIDIVPRAVRDFFENLPKQTLKTMKKRRKEIELIELS